MHHSASLARTNFFGMYAPLSPCIMNNYYCEATIFSRFYSKRKYFRGAESGVFAALLPPGTAVRGEYIWDDCSTLDWVEGPLPDNFA